MFNPWNAIRSVKPVELDRPIYAHAGEIITCDNDHPIATFARDVRKAEMITTSMFRDWDNAPTPERNQSFRKCNCSRCGSPWIKASCIGGPIVKIDGQWRSEHPDDFKFMSEVDKLQ